MKRIFSFALAAMMTIAMGVLPAFAEPHDDHYIKFAEGDSITLPEATEGEAYSYALDPEKCGEFDITAVAVSEEDLPTGLSVASAGGISGIPAAAGTYEFDIEVTGQCPEDPASARLTKTVTCSLTVAEPAVHAHKMYFDKELMDEHADGHGFDLPPATVGQPYEYELKYTACEHMGNITFSANEDLVDPTRCLPGGLSLDLNSGKISGTPAPDTEGDYVVELQVEGRWGEGEGTPIANTNTFYLTVQPEQRVVTWRIPYTKRVVRGGSRNPGSQTFELEIFGVGVGLLEDQVTIFGNTGIIDTNGSGDYLDYVSVVAPANALEEGFKVKEKDGNAARWTYSDAFYTVWPVRDASGKITDQFRIYEGDYDGVEGEGTECATMTFTNTYSYSPSYDRDDDDDDDRDRPDPKPEKEQPEKDEEKSNPVTGR